MSAQCYEHRFGYCTNAKTCFNVHFGAILAERRVLLGRGSKMIKCYRKDKTGTSRKCAINVSASNRNHSVYA